MKISKIYLLISLLTVSLFSNILLCFHIVHKENPNSSISKFTYSMHDTVIYCEKSSEVNTIKADFDENSFTIGDSKLLNADDSVYLISHKGKIRLSDYEGFGFVINSEGDLLYSLNTPVKKQQTVYITPSGKKYHTKQSCAGKNSIETDLETAKLLREPCKLCA